MTYRARCLSSGKSSSHRCHHCRLETRTYIHTYIHTHSAFCALKHPSKVFWSVLVSRLAETHARTTWSRTTHARHVHPSLTSLTMNVPSFFATDPRTSYPRDRYVKYWVWFRADWTRIYHVRVIFETKWIWQTNEAAEERGGLSVLSRWQWGRDGWPSSLLYTLYSDPVQPH